MIPLVLLEQIVVLFLMMAAGFALVRLHMATSAESRLLTVITIYLVLPCVIVNAFQIDYSEEIRDGFLLAIGAAVLIHVLLFLMCWLFGKMLHLCIVERASLIYSNAGNLIIPLVIAVLGSEWVIYASAFMCVQMLFLWTHGQSLLEGQLRINWREIFRNINLMAILVGIVLFFAGVRLPVLIADTFDYLASMLAPLSMIMLGMLMAGIDWREVFLGRRIYVITLLKMIVFPVIILLFLKFCGVSGLVPEGRTILLISLLAVTTPSATTVTQLAQLYDHDAVYAGAINALTTLVCIATMPLMVMLYML